MTNSPNTTPPSPSKKSKRKNKIKKRLSRLKQSWPIYTAALFGGFTVSFMGFVVNAVQFMDILDPKLDPNTLSSEWILVKINGWGVTSYRQAEQQEGIGRFLPLLSSNLRATSDLIAMIYTDAPTGE